MPFLSENDLFNLVICSPFMGEFVGSAVYPTISLKEPKGLFGIPDLAIANLSSTDFDYSVLRTFAFELKLSNWKRAISQAYKYKAFSNYSFVVIDRNYLHRAIVNIDKFRISNIGLISVDSTGFMMMHFCPAYDYPYSESLSLKFEKKILQQMQHW